MGDGGDSSSQDVLCDFEMAYGIILGQPKDVNSSQVCCCDETFLGDQVSVALAITGNQTWESALAETRSPIARTFNARTGVELEHLMRKALGGNLTQFQ